MLEKDKTKLKRTKQWQQDTSMLIFPVCPERD